MEVVAAPMRNSVKNLTILRSRGIIGSRVSGEKGSDAEKALKKFEFYQMCKEGGKKKSGKAGI
tara:strand:+ start:104 stop:292 length:189 start_codon:yes stop_codon:yes gene_type:complete